MIDFLSIATRTTKKGTIEVYPKFIIKNPSADLMIRGGDFYAVWVEERGLWSTNEQDVIQIVDRELDNFARENSSKFDTTLHVLHMWDAETGMIDKWHRYCQSQMRDSFHMLDEKLIFSNTETKRDDYASKRLSYPLEPGDIHAYDKLIGTLYKPEERHKIEWAIGSIVSGESKELQKFMVLYGAAGTGKSTIINIIQKLFDGYCSVFDAKALGSSNNSFALEAFKTNPLVAIQHDGDLSKIEDNTRLNSLVSHELMTVNEKFKSTYSNSFKCFLIMGTNKPVKITDAKSGLIRRLIDVSPSGDKVSQREYRQLVRQIDFELGAIAAHCRDVYLDDPTRYDDYLPLSMMSSTNDFYNFILDMYFTFRKEDSTTLKQAWEAYKTYNEEAKVAYGYSKRLFKEELKNYFRVFEERHTNEDGTRVSGYYYGFKTEKFEPAETVPAKPQELMLIDFQEQESILDKELADCQAQYASAAETPIKKWESVKTTLASLDTSRVHYVKPPENHIVIDFDIPDEDGNKCYARNLEEASKWPPTYAELSKSGAGIHLHYIYTGDVSKLARVCGNHIEIKVFTGNSSLRRKLTKCNGLPIAKISSNLPLKGEKVINFDAVTTEKGIRTLIERNLNKEIHPGTKPSIDFIYKILEDAYTQGVLFDVTDMRTRVLAFAAKSTHQADYCIKLVNKMHFKSDEHSESVPNEDAGLIFYDVEVFPNLFLVNWKLQGKGNPIVRMINPTPTEIENLVKYRLVGFNCRRYDNHMLYARMIGYTNEQLYDLSQKIVGAKKGSKGVFFGEAYNISYTDIYDFASAGNKKSLKKLEIEMDRLTREDLTKLGFSEEEIDIIKAGGHHQELGLPWNQPVPEELWTQVAEYCDNDVIATEASFVYLKADRTARQILADLAGMSVNDTTNSLTTRIIFGKNKTPQGEFCYRNMAEPVRTTDISAGVLDFLKEACPDMMAEPHGPENSILPYFPGYVYDHGKSTYRGEEVGEGGYVYAEPGMHTNVALLDVSSMHPHSLIAECLFGENYTRVFRDLVEARVSIKHEDWDTVAGMLNGLLIPYIEKVKNGELTSKQLADALKTAINSVYGLTSASFETPFHDTRNKDNIVAKRGALFMIDLKNEVQKRGFTVAHIKTDSIKIPNATPEIIQFVMDFGRRYGYSFEHEATYDRMCLVNDAVYIAKYKDGKHAGEWTATGAQFAVPYVFKTLFSKEPIVFDDLCETKSVSSALYLDMNEKLEDVSKLEKELYVIEKENREPERQEELRKIIADNHDYHFIGKISRFCPIKPGYGGGELVREGVTTDGKLKYSSATGAKGYRWLESEVVRASGMEEAIDKTYYETLVHEAVENISQYGDFEWFVTESSDDDTPPWFSAGEPFEDDRTPFDVR